jgi:excisionase family DNA binding protein
MCARRGARLGGMARQQRAPVERETLTVEEAGLVLGVSRGTAYAAVRQGQLPTIRLGRRLVVPRAALDAMLASAGRSEAKPVGDCSTGIEA